jgi:hypothetical protein
MLDSCRDPFSMGTGGHAMTTFRPLSRRGRPDDRFDQPQPGLPEYLLHPVLDWLDPILWVTDHSEFGRQTPNVDVLRDVQLVLRLQEPLDWGREGYSARTSLIELMRRDRDCALDVLDFFVQHIVSPAYANKLGHILTLGGSEWEVALIGEDGRQLSQRVIGPVRESIEEVRTYSERAHHHLSRAWERLVGRQPDPSTAYREAIRAIEVVAKPVVTPDDGSATLGKIIRAIRDKPEKWETVLDKSSPLQVADLADLVWRGQLDRHGTDEPSAPLNVKQEEADAAVHLAVPLVRLFVSGGIRPK